MLSNPARTSYPSTSEHPTLTMMPTLTPSHSPSRAIESLAPSLSLARTLSNVLNYGDFEGYLYWAERVWPSRCVKKVLDLTKTHLVYEGLRCRVPGVFVLSSPCAKFPNSLPHGSSISRLLQDQNNRYKCCSANASLE